MTECPLIGISTYREQASWGVWDVDAAVLPYNYVDCVAAAGGVPLLLPPIENNRPADGAGAGVETTARTRRPAAQLVGNLDALVISGGPDANPALYGALPHVETGPPRDQRDEWELALLAAALDRDIPVLAICRGAQLLNIAFGGSLHQHLPEVSGVVDHRAGTAVYADTRVTLAPESLPGSVLGPTVHVSCYHHQAIAKLGAGLAVTGRAPDGTIEAVTVDGRAFAVGVQWHPEADRELRLFAALVEAAVQSRSRSRRRKEELSQP